MINLAMQPKARWMGRFTRPRMQRKVGNYLNCVQVFQPGATPLIVVMRHQGIECDNKYDGGGVAEDNRSKKWYRDFARAIGDEARGPGLRAGRHRHNQLPEEVAPQVADGPVPLRRGHAVQAAQRHDLPRGHRVRLEARLWTARMLRSMGVCKVRGFMLNVTHHDWTTRTSLRPQGLAHGRRQAVRDLHLLQRPWPGALQAGQEGPLPPRERVLQPALPRPGAEPNTNTQLAGVDAFLYLNRPGVSGAGTCNGGFKAGEWWPERALMYSKYATEWYGPLQGHPLRVPPADLAVCPGRAGQGRAGLQRGLTREALQQEQQSQPIGLENGAALAHSVGQRAPPRPLPERGPAVRGRRTGGPAAS